MYFSLYIQTVSQQLNNSYVLLCQVNTYHACDYRHYSNRMVGNYESGFCWIYRFTKISRNPLSSPGLDLQLSPFLRTALAMHRGLSVAQVLVLFAVLNWLSQVPGTLFACLSIFLSASDYCLYMF